LLYNRNVKSHDAIVIGAGVIGLSLARRLQLSGLKVLVIEKHKPASEASYAAGGMIAACDPHIADCLKALVAASARMYPEFVSEIELESDAATDLRTIGTIAWFERDEEPGCESARRLGIDELRRIEPLLPSREGAWFLPERSIDPHELGSVLTKAAKRVGVDVITGSAVDEVMTANGRAAGVKTSHTAYPAKVVVNCAGAWAAQIARIRIPTRPVKGQMVCLLPAADAPHQRPIIKHVVRTPDVYIIPRSDGRILLGATVEDAGFDKRVDPDTIQRLHHAGVSAVPALGSMGIHDAWAGLRPGSPDDLPIMGETSLPGYFAATGHYRDGIMLAPITAHLMSQLICGGRPDFDLKSFSPQRF
jgi:glycine oxidase